MPAVWTAEELIYLEHMIRFQVFERPKKRVRIEQMVKMQEILMFW